MKLIKVAAYHEKNDDEPGREYIVIANTPEEALDLVNARGDNESYKRFLIAGVVEGTFDGPPRVTGYIGQGPFTWK